MSSSTAPRSPTTPSGGPPRYCGDRRLIITIVGRGTYVAPEDERG